MADGKAFPIGVLDHFVIFNTRDECTVRAKGTTVIVYHPERKWLRLCRPVTRATRDEYAAIKHKAKGIAAPTKIGYHQFHGEDPEHWQAVEWYDQHPGHMVKLGLIDWIFYKIPKRWDSLKAGEIYKHQFGDFDGTRTKLDERWCPGLWQDQVTGFLHIRRRTGNAWYVDDYIRG